MHLSEMLRYKMEILKLNTIFPFIQQTVYTSFMLNVKPPQGLWDESDIARW